MPYARTDDRVKFYCELHSEGAPLVLAYGSGGNAGMWDVNVRAVVEHRAVLWEPQSHARSDSPEDPAKYSFARWVLDLKTVMDHLGLCAPGGGGAGGGGAENAGSSTGPLLRLCSDPAATTTEVQR